MFSFHNCCFVLLLNCSIVLLLKRTLSEIEANIKMTINLLMSKQSQLQQRKFTAYRV